LAITFDISDEYSVENAFEQIEAQHGPIAVLVSAAGLLLLYAMQRTQGLLPLNPAGMRYATT